MNPDSPVSAEGGLGVPWSAEGGLGVPLSAAKGGLGVPWSGGVEGEVTFKIFISFLID